MSSRSSAPLFATINVTTACNLDCAYCYMQPLSGVHMPRMDFERVVDELRDLKVFFITLSGGEPFMHPQIGSFLTTAHRKFRHVMTLTNGTAITSAHFATIRSILQEKGALTLQVSLDAVDTSVNGLTRSRSKSTIRNIARLSDMGCHVIVAMVVTRHNLATILDSINVLSAHTRWFHLMTVQDVRMVHGIEASLAAGNADHQKLWQEVRAFATERNLAINTPLTYEGERGCAEGAPCMAAFSHIVIDPDLKVRPCDRLVDVVLGDLHRTSISEIWNGPTVEPLLASTVPMCRRTDAEHAGPVKGSTSAGFMTVYRSNTRLRG